VSTTVAAVLFVINIAHAIGSRDYLPYVLGPTAAAQRPVKEVGLLPLARSIRAEGGPAAQPVVIVTAVNDAYVEYSALNLAMRYVNDDAWSPIQFEPVPLGSADFDLRRLLASRWFLTKRPRSTIALQGDVWVSLYALDNLITE